MGKLNNGQGENTRSKDGASIAPSSSSSPSPAVSSAFSSLSPSDRQLALQAAASMLVRRFQLAQLAGWESFDGLRNFFSALGFKQTLTIADYRQRYQRGGIAKRLVDCLPEEMWDDGITIRENDYDPEKPSEFETQASMLFSRLDVESRMMKADILAGLGQYSIVLIGVREKGENPNLSLPLPRLRMQEDVIYLLQYAQDNAKVISLITNANDPRFGQPEFYEITTANPAYASTNAPNVSTPSLSPPLRVHWSRVIHIAHGLVESDWIGTPDLEASWNDLESLYKVAWGGPEGEWRNMDKGVQWDLDPEYTHTPDALLKMDEQIEEMRHNLRRDIKTSGVKANSLGGKVNAYGSNIDSHVKLIGGTHGIPYTILTGEELGLRAGENNRDNLDILTSSRRKKFGTPLVRQLVDRLLLYGALPKLRSDGYQVVWGVEDELDEKEKAELAKTYADANRMQKQAGGGLLYTTNEIRDKVGDEPIAEEEVAEPAPGAEEEPIPAPELEPTPELSPVVSIADRKLAR